MNLVDGSTPFGQRRRTKRTTVRWDHWVDDYIADIQAIGGAMGLADPIEALSEGGCEPIITVSLADADRECVHGRLRGDRCPQPATVPHEYSGWKPNPNRLWTMPFPCKCWGEPRAVGTPDLLATLAEATPSHDASPKPVGLPKTQMSEAENGRKPAVGQTRSRSAEARLGA